MRFATPCKRNDVIGKQPINIPVTIVFVLRTSWSIHCNEFDESHEQLPNYVNINI